MMTFDPSDESSLRAAVHEAYAQFVPATEISGFQSGVRAGGRRLRAVRWASGTAGGIAVLAAVLFTWGTFGQESTQAPGAAAVAPPVCPSALPDGPTPGPVQKGADKKLVPGHPVSGAYCDFVSTPTADLKSVTTLRKSGTLSGSEFTAVLNATHTPVIGGPVSCAPSLAGEHLLLLFRYASGPDVTVSLSLHGCPDVSNGSLTGMFAPAGQTPSALEALGLNPGATDTPSGQRR